MVPGWLFEDDELGTKKEDKSGNHLRCATYYEALATAGKDWRNEVFKTRIPKGEAKRKQRDEQKKHMRR